jgi:hypothetical protein
MSFFWREPPVFLPNRVDSGSFLTVILFLHLQVVLHEERARLEKTDHLESLQQPNASPCIQSYAYDAAEP